MKHYHYYDFTDELTPDEIYKGLLSYGMFAEKLPPVFTAENFFDYCENNHPQFSVKPSEYIYYESMRNINVPRSMGIPNPVVYFTQCKHIANIWPYLQKYFKEQTRDQNHVISRIHIRKMKDKQALFLMNYRSWKDDDATEANLLFGAKYLVKADISNCFPSIYTHSLPWALVGKNKAKDNKNKKDEWYNKLDLYTRNIKFGETHGLLIGPHTSNLLSEIILIRIDNILYSKGWRYVRNIDDYTCYVATYEEGQLFLTDLSEQLREYDLTLNHKKTMIEKLPSASVEHWVRKLKLFTTLAIKDKMKLSDVRSYLDLIIDLMKSNKENAAVLTYAIKVFSKKKLLASAEEYYIKMIFHLVIIYPYLVSLLEEYVFIPFNVHEEEIAKLANLLYQDGIKLKNYEAVSYALYYACKYNFVISTYKFEDAKQSNNCIFLLFSYLYCTKKDNKELVKEHKNYARQIMKKEMDLFWLFIYEVLPQSDLKEYWKLMKKANVSFLKDF